MIIVQNGKFKLIRTLAGLAKDWHLLPRTRSKLIKSSKDLPVSVFDPHYTHRVNDTPLSPWDSSTRRRGVRHPVRRVEKHSKDLCSSNLVLKSLYLAVEVCLTPAISLSHILYAYSPIRIS